MLKAILVEPWCQYRSFILKSLWTVQNRLTNLGRCIQALT